MKPMSRKVAGAIANASRSRGAFWAITVVSAYPPAEFYLWLDVGDGPAFAKALWRETGVRVLPGAFMCIEKNPGDPASNPGFRYVRLALVHDAATVTAALECVAEFLQGVWQI